MQRCYQCRQLTVGDDNPTSSNRHHRGEAFDGERRIEGDISAPRREHSENRRRELQGAGQADGHRFVGRHARAAQSRRQPRGMLVEVAVTPGAAGRCHRGGVRSRGHLFAKALDQAASVRGGLGEKSPVNDQPLSLLLVEQPGARDWLRGSIEERSEKDREGCAKSGDSGVVEQAPIVLKRPPQPFAIRFEEQREIKLRRPGVNGDWLHGHAGKRQWRNTRRREHEERVHDRLSFPGPLPGGCQHNLVERQPPLADGSQERLPHPADEFRERLSGSPAGIVPPHPHWKRVEIAVDRFLEFERAAQGDGRTDDDIVAAGHTVEPGVEGGQEDLECCRSCLPG